MSEERYRRKYERAAAKVEILERMIEDKSRELYETHENSRHMALFGALNPAPVLRVDPQGLVMFSNPAALTVFGEGVAQDANLADLLPEFMSVQLAKCIRESKIVTFESTIEGRHFHFAVRGVAEDQFANVYGSDTTDIKQLEIELRHAQKLESVGQLAAGVAHEINTPMQFIGDNVHFLREACEDMLNVLGLFGKVVDGLPADVVAPAQRAELEEAVEFADLDYLRERAPKAFERTLDGISRVTEIVAAMKAFSHPNREKAPVDLNEAIGVTLTVAKNEYKYVADVETDFGALPEVVCNGGDINQVFLNLFVNAAHAIEDVVKESGDRGTIRVSTERDGHEAVIRVEDSGCGMPEDVKQRIFDPFFTTKEVGRGTGQGLSLVHTVIVDRHGGSIHVDSEPGRGTTFIVRLPLGAGVLGAAA